SICSPGHFETRRASAMSNRSFINRTAEEWRQRLVVGRVVLLEAGLVGCFERIKHGIHRLVGIGDLALPLHRVEIIHIGLIGLLIVAEQTHWVFRDSFSFDAFSSREPVSTSLENALVHLTRFLHANRYPLRSKTL